MAEDVSMTRSARRTHYGMMENELVEALSKTMNDDFRFQMLKRIQSDAMRKVQAETAWLSTLAS